MLIEEYLGAYNFNVLRELLDLHEIIKLGVGVEIGVLDGGTSLHLLKSFPQLTLIGIDPYLAYHEYDQKRMNEAEATALSRLQQFGQRSLHMKEDSLSAAQKIADESIDFVFIDADHTYQAAKRDIEAWYPKVRKGGFFSGHDYRWEGVNRAVNEFATSRNLQGYFTPKESDVWWFIKYN